MTGSNAAGAPPLDAWFDEHDTWTVTTQPSSLAHYAMWPAKLAERLILSMCPAEVCVQCGEPRRRIEGRTERYAEARSRLGGFCVNPDAGLNQVNNVRFAAAENVTLGWSDCGCGAGFTPGTVLDPFAGTGTTLAVADLHGRDAIGIDIDARNEALYPARRAEVARNLFGSKREIVGQIDLFSGSAIA